MSTPPDPEHVEISKHAAEQFVERAKPESSVVQAATELERLKLSGTITASPPAWVRDKVERPFYLVISDAYVLPLAPTDDPKIWRAVTTLVSVGMSDVTRQRRRDHKDRKARSKRRF